MTSRRSPIDAEHAATEAAAVRRARIVAVGGVLLSAIVGLAITAALWGDLPDPVASHFGADGRANGFSSKVANTVFLGLFPLGLGLVLGLSLMQGRRYTLMHRWSCALTVGTTAFVIATGALVLLEQRGLSDAHEARVPLLSLLPALAVGVVVAGAAYAACPRPGPPIHEGTAPTMALADGERAVWTASEHNRVLVVMAVATIVAGLVLAFVSGVPTWVSLLVIVVGVLGLSTASVHLRVDNTGATWWMGYGLPRGRIPLADIERAEAVEVTPLSHGGWGIRISGKGLGVIVRSGPGVTFTRANRPDLTVTVPDAARGAALANSLSARARSEARHR